MLVDICHRVLNGFVMPVEQAISVVVPIFNGKGDSRNCSCYLAVNLFEYEMKMVEIVLENRLRRIVTVDEMKFGFMPERGTIDPVFISIRLQEEYHA